jgi:hypothetical protein
VRFVVSRTSMCSDEQPCPEAVAARLPAYDRRTCKSAAEFDARIGRGEPGTPSGPWESWGSEHTIEQGPRGGATGITRRRPADQKVWTIEIDSLDALLSFADKHGDLVLTRHVGNEVEREIEIYDGWRE